MAVIIAWVIAVISATAFLLLWFGLVRRELVNKKDTVNSARGQLSVCRKMRIQAGEGAEGRDAQCILTRSSDIYRQAVKSYNLSLRKPQNRIPGFLMGFREIAKGDER